MNPSDLYKMWFEAVVVDGRSEIGYAESTDGVSWTVKDAAGNSGAGAGSVPGRGANPGFDDFTIEAPSVVLEADASDNPIRYHLWYEAGRLLGHPPP